MKSIKKNSLMILAIASLTLMGLPSAWALSRNDVEVQVKLECSLDGQPVAPANGNDRLVLTRAQIRSRAPVTFLIGKERINWKLMRYSSVDSHCLVYGPEKIMGKVRLGREMTDMSAKDLKYTSMVCGNGSKELPWHDGAVSIMTYGKGKRAKTLMCTVHNEVFSPTFDQ